MDLIIGGLTRASVGVPEPTKDNILSVVAELRKLKSAAAGILEQMQVEEGEEVSLQVFIGQLDAIASVAEEPMSTWLGEIGKALLSLGDVMAMPPPELPASATHADTILAPVHTSATLMNRTQPPAEEDKDKLESPGGAQSGRGKEVDKNTALLPRFFTSGTREAPIELPDSPIIKGEPGVEDEELLPLAQKQLHTTISETALSSSRDHHQDSSLRAAPVQPKQDGDLQHFKPNDHHGGITIGKPSECERCHEKFPSRKQMLAHISQKHPDHPLPLWRRTDPSRLDEGNGQLSPAGQLSEGGRERAWSGAGRDQQWKRGRGGWGR